MTPRWQLASHLEYLDRHLVAVEKGEIRKLMIQMPPRHGESKLVSKHFSAWYLGLRPERDLLKRHGQAQFGIHIKGGRAANGDWEIEDWGGGMFSTGIGPMIGRGANVLVVDDPVKNAEEAESVTIQERNLEWYYSMARTRLEPGDKEILIMTRWHENDLAGRLLTSEGHEWDIVRLPALAEVNDPLGRFEDEALWPERFSREELVARRSGEIDPDIGERRGGIGAYLFAAMYQQ